MSNPPPYDKCCCAACGPPWRDLHPEPSRETDFAAWLGWHSWMALCPTCGNKRCPGAANHLNPCSGSNEPGQVIPSPVVEPAASAQVVRWPGKPTSGRYVYGYPDNRWLWQCDRHYELADDEESPGGAATTMQEAFAQAPAHALVCPFDNRKRATT